MFWVSASEETVVASKEYLSIPQNKIMNYGIPRKRLLDGKHTDQSTIHWRSHLVLIYFSACGHPYIFYLSILFLFLGLNKCSWVKKIKKTTVLCVSLKWWWKQQQICWKKPECPNYFCHSSGALMLRKASHRHEVNISFPKIMRNGICTLGLQILPWSTPAAFPKELNPQTFNLCPPLPVQKATYSGERMQLFYSGKLRT